MQHFKEFLLLVQSLDIQIGQMSATRHGSQQQINYYDISHENPFLNATFKNQLKELKELAITDILNMPREQILNQLQRLERVRAGFLKFWEKYYHLPFPMGSEQNLEVIYNLNLDNFFICPQLTFMDQATASDSFIDDLETTIRHRQSILIEFEAEVLKIVNRDKENSVVVSATSDAGRIRLRPISKKRLRMSS
jgi:hypothetical protein